MRIFATNPLEPVLPHLLSLPPGVVAGISPRLAGPTLRRELAEFGPSVKTDHELRHAVHRVPARLVVEAGWVSTPLVGASLAALRRGGTVLVLCTEDCGRLLEWCDRILVVAGAGWRWLAPDDLRAARCLLLRVSGSAGWVRVPLAGSVGAEAVLAAFAADRVRVCESRIAYQAVGAR